MQQTNIEIPEQYSFEEIELEKIITENGNENLYKPLLNSVQKVGILQSVVLIREGDNYRVIAGKKRILAAKEADLGVIPAIVYEEGLSELQMALFRVIENMNRTPNPAIEAESLDRIMAEYRWSASELSRELGIPVSHVRARIRLLQLIPEFFEKLKEGKLKVTVAQKLCRLPKETQKELLKEEKLTLEKVEAVCREKAIERLIPLEFFQLPVTSQLERIKKELREIVLQAEGEKKEKLVKALSLIEEVD